MLDLHMTHIIANGIKYYSSARQLFHQLFPHVGDSLKARMFAWLNASKPNFDLGFNKLTTKKMPLITVEITEALYDAQGLGNSSGSIYSAVGEPLTEIKYVHEFTSQECRVNIYAGEIEGIRVLHAIVKASVLIFTPQLLNAGYQNILYLGTSSLEPEPQLQSEAGMGVYGRQCVYGALHLSVLPFKVEDLTNIGEVAEPLDIQVQKSIYGPADLPSGEGGGVDVE